MKKCFKCNQEKPLSYYYKHKKMADGFLGKCKDCTKKDVSLRNGNEVRNCLICKKEFKTWITEINRGGGKLCSRNCYYIHLKQTRPKEEKSWAWKGDKITKGALHDWVVRHLGKPNNCEHCDSTNAKKYEWANKSQKYKRELSDWLRLCPKCHARYDYKTRVGKWRKSVRKLGWNV